MKGKRKTDNPRKLFLGFSVVLGMFAIMSIFIIASGHRVSPEDKVLAAVGCSCAFAILSGTFLIAYAILEAAGKKEEGQAVEKKEEKG